MKPFTERNADLVKEAISYIDSRIRMGSYVSLANPDEGCNDLDCLLGLPFVTYVSKHGFYDQYAIVAVKKEKAQITLYTICTGEDSDEREFTLDDVDSSNLFALADTLTLTLRKG